MRSSLEGGFMNRGFVIRRSKSPSLYLSPFADQLSAKQWDEQEGISWYSSTPLTTKEKDDLLFEMYKDIDLGVDRWIQDVRYLPRLLIGALVFLVTYFFFSLAVRDPIPIIDELLLATGATIAVWSLISSRDKKSDMAMKRRLMLKQNAARTDFILEENLSRYEQYLDDADYINTIDLADQIALVGNHTLAPLKLKAFEHQETLHTMLLTQVKLDQPKMWSWYQKLLVARSLGKEDVSLSARLLKLAMAGQLDLPLMALLLAVAKQ